MFSAETIDPSHFSEEMFELYSVPKFELGIPEIIRGQEIGSSKQSIREKDVLVCKINPRINRVWIAGHITPHRILASSEWIVFRNSFLFAPYLRYYFSSPYFRNLLLSNVSGVGGSLMRAQPESVRKYPILIPPYQEQIRILYLTIPFSFAKSKYSFPFTQKINLLYRKKWSLQRNNIQFATIAPF